MQTFPWIDADQMNRQEKNRAFSSPVPTSAIPIKIVGVGDAGSNVLLRLAKTSDFPAMGVSLLAINSDTQQFAALRNAKIETLQIGASIARGRGTGGQIEIGEKAALNDEDQIRRELQNAQLVFLVAGLGGGMGTGATPIIAQILHHLNILTVAVVTTPFFFEGKRKKEIANDGIFQLRPYVDGLIAIHNDQLMKSSALENIALTNAFQGTDKVLLYALTCILEIILRPGNINIDFTDIKTILQQGETSDVMLGIGEADNALDALKNAMNAPFLEPSLLEARGIIVNLTSDGSLDVEDTDKAMEFLNSQIHNPTIIFGTAEDKQLNGRIRATIIATDFDDNVITYGELIYDDESDLEITQELPKIRPEKNFAQKNSATKKMVAPQIKGAVGIQVPSFLKK